MTVNLGQMRAFLAVAERGGVAAAAEALGVTRPAVTMQIKALEQEIGRELFRREGHGFAMNEAGRELLGQVARLLSVVEETDAALARLRDPRRGRLRLGACAPFVLVELLAAFRARRPEVAVASEIANSASLRAAIESGRLDIAVTTLRAPLPGFFNLALTTQRVCAMVPVASPLARRAELGLEELAPLPTVLREPGSMTRALVDDALAARGLKLADAMVVGSREAVKEAAARGLGVAYVLSREVGRDDRLAAVPIPGEDLSATETLLCQQSLAGLGLVRDFIETAREAFGGAA